MSNFDSLKIASLNCRGIKINKLFQIKDLISFHSIDILLLQETHICSIKEKEEIELFFNEFKCFFPLSENKTKGVGAIIKSEFDITNFGFYENRILFFDSNFCGKILTILNIYSPNTSNDQILFIEEIFKLGLNRKENLVIGGDFNCDFEKEKSIKSKNYKEWMNLVKVFELEIINQGKNKGYTWSSGVRKSNIDYFLFKKKMNLSI